VFDGVVENGISSSFSGEQWEEWLEKNAAWLGVDGGVGWVERREKLWSICGTTLVEEYRYRFSVIQFESTLSHGSTSSILRDKRHQNQTPDIYVCIRICESVLSKRGYFLCPSNGQSISNCHKKRTTKVGQSQYSPASPLKLPPMDGVHEIG
jgi:hypothetical protein